MPTKRNSPNMTKINMDAMKKRHATLKGKVAELEGRIGALESWVFKGKLPKAG